MWIGSRRTRGSLFDQLERSPYNPILKWPNHWRRTMVLPEPERALLLGDTNLRGSTFGENVTANWIREKFLHNWRSCSFRTAVLGTYVFCNSATYRLGWYSAACPYRQVHPYTGRLQTWIRQFYAPDSLYGEAADLDQTVLRPRQFYAQGSFTPLLFLMCPVGGGASIWAIRTESNLNQIYEWDVY